MLTCSHVDLHEVLRQPVHRQPADGGRFALFKWAKETDSAQPIQLQLDISCSFSTRLGVGIVMNNIYKV